MDWYVGEIRLFAGIFAPNGWALCQGQLLNVSEYQMLFSLLGTTYGGNGSTTFGLPNLLSRVVIGTGNGPGLTPRAIGATGGTDTVALTEANNPSHTHNYQVSTAAAQATTPAGNALAAPDSPVTVYLNTTKSTATLPLATGAMAPTFNGLPHDNHMPSMTLNYIIALAGIYPQFD